MRAKNPLFNEKVIGDLRSLYADGAMTVNGTINKTIISFMILVFGTLFTWYAPMESSGLMMIGLFGGMILAFLTMFKKNLAPYTTPFYALCEGFVLGGISAMYNAAFEGIVFNAILATFGVFAAMLGLYRFRIIRVTERFRSIIISMLMGIMLVFVASWILRLFGVQLGLVYGTGPLAIVFSLIVIGVAAFSLLLDFDMIERGSEANLPSYMEWYGAMSIMITVVWLYLEILRLLAILQGRD